MQNDKQPQNETISFDISDCISHSFMQLHRLPKLEAYVIQQLHDWEQLYGLRNAEPGCTGDLLKVLDVEGDDKLLQTTYGELHPPLGTHRLKV